MCEHSIQLHAYHDGELSPALRVQLEAHVAGCEECRRELDELRQMARLLVAAPMPQMPADLPARIASSFESARRAKDSGLRKLAGWLNAAAAVILLAATVRMSGMMTRGTEKQPTEASSGLRDWELSAVMPPDRQVDDAGSADLIQVAQWMARDLSSDERR
jgi:anti-sigma factor RsiW